MKTKEFIENYQLHDSLVKGYVFSIVEGKLTLELELCNWKQAGYTENEPEMVDVKLNFQRVKSFKIDPENFVPNYNDILTTEPIIGGVKFVVLYEGDVAILTIIADVLFFELK
ncbi:hypothetical protein [Paenibacillus whitsoniae]|uniref:Uncharacterized protein n=1 Tax=Paenibacillus whitsoniae TaxID=2496558 RepID=A0A3S0BIK4_9BACL|nr:hypothetical protein [Paenibacillus whitsoniae]RTE06440.1 hypothetical protein EJQ19_22925 [Paenibacillus whitsoniae]